MHLASFQPQNRPMAHAVLRTIRPRIQAELDGYSDAVQENLTLANELRPRVARLVDDFNSDIVSTEELPMPEDALPLQPIMPISYPLPCQSITSAPRIWA
jgi:hypothetical protein